MERLGTLSESYTLQFWSRGWLSQELFVKTLLADFPKSLVLGFDGESEFQTFVDGCPNKVSLSGFHQCPIWYDIRYYLLNEAFLRPAITLPESSLLDVKNTVSEVSYNETFLFHSVIYTCMPSFRKEGIDSFETVPTFQQKINDLRILIQVIDNSREICVGCINGVVLRGSKFLAQLAREFRVSLSFYHEEFPLQWAPKARLFHKTERWRRHPGEVIEPLGKYSSAIADLIFLLQNVEWLVHRQGHWVPGSISQTVESLASALTHLRCRDWALRANDCLRNEY